MTDAREQPKVRAMLGRLRPALLGVLLLCFWSTLGAAQQGRVQRGRVFAQTNCAMCHAVGRIGDSPLAIAPPFRTLHTRYRVDDLAEALAEGIVTGHPSMPQFQLDAAQIGDLIAYLKTLEP
jgi:mono/diheme cytochrome c family protein